MTLLSSNTGIDALKDHDFKLLYSRRKPLHPPVRSPVVPPPERSRSLFSRASSSTAADEDDGSRLVATLVAVDPQGIIRAKIEPEHDGRDVGEAFRAFKRDVEVKLEVLLRDVPDGLGLGQAATAGRASGSPVEAVTASVGREGPPPAYGDCKVQQP
jgi:hypothetical protein